MEETLSFASLLVAIFQAFVVPLVFFRSNGLRLPIVVDEILVGPSGMQWVAHQERY